MRKYKRKTDRATVPVDVRKRAVQAHLVDKLSLNAVSEQFAIPVRTLARYCQIVRKKNNAECCQEIPEVGGYRGHRQVREFYQIDRYLHILHIL